MPYYSCAFRSVPPENGILEKLEEKEPQMSSLLLLSRQIREKACNVLLSSIIPISKNILLQKQTQGPNHKVKIESWTLMPHLNLAFSHIVEMVSATELANESISNLSILDHFLKTFWNCVEAIDDAEKDKAIQMNSWMLDIIEILKEKDKNQFGSRTCSPLSWFVWGQALIKISRNYLLPRQPSSQSSDSLITYRHHQSLFLHCLDLAATKFEKCIRLLKQNASFVLPPKKSKKPVVIDSPTNKILSESMSAIGYICLTKAKEMNETEVRKWYFDEAQTHLKQAIMTLPGPNCVYNLACVAALKGRLMECKSWLDAGLQHSMIPPLIHIFHDSDLDSCRDASWFSDFLARVPSEKPSSDKKWMFSQEIALSLLQSTFAMPAPVLNLDEQKQEQLKILHLPKPRKTDFVEVESLNQQLNTNPKDDQKSTQNNLFSSQLTESMVFDEDLNKLQASLQRDGFSKSTVLNMVKEVYKQKKAEKTQHERFEAAHARLMVRLTAAGMKQKSVIPGDGNCQFHSISDQLFDSIEQSAWVRQQIIAWLRTHGDWSLPENAAQLKDFALEDWDSYCDHMSKNGIWGDHITLIAASHLFGVRIVLFSSIEDDNYVTEYIPSVVTSPKILFLCHYAEYHYGSICKAEPTTEQESSEDTSFQMFSNQH